jgi:hypothetical protein
MARRVIVRQRSTIPWCVALISISFLMSLSASASLGDNVSSVQSDAQHLKASVRVTQTQNYAVHELQASGGTTVREYISPEGKVFAVAWQGPARPDLQQLLGTYYETVVQALQADKAQHPGRHPISIQQPGLVVQMGGHQRDFSGNAYVPALMPSAIRAEEIR